MSNSTCLFIPNDFNHPIFDIVLSNKFSYLCNESAKERVTMDSIHMHPHNNTSISDIVLSNKLSYLYKESANEHVSMDSIEMHPHNTTYTYSVITLSARLQKDLTNHPLFTGNNTTSILVSNIYGIKAILDKRDLNSHYFI